MKEHAFEKLDFDFQLRPYLNSRNNKKYVALFLVLILTFKDLGSHHSPFFQQEKPEQFENQ